MEPPDAPLTAALARLDARIDWERRDRGALRPGLGPIEALVAALGFPERAYRTVHIAGTKGKGSVAALVAAALEGHVGVYGSPHVSRVQERIRLDGREVEDGLLARSLNAALDQATPAATWFDVMTAAAFVAFRESGVDWGVVEVGLGGRLDSTNVVAPAACAITSIDLEHTDVLGDTRAAIAGEKAGILKPGVPCVTGVEPGSEAGEVIAARARELGCPLTWAPTGGTLVERNLATARALLDLLGVPSTRLDDPQVRAAATLPGRLERARLGPIPVVLDGAHVPSSLRAVLEDLAGDPALSGPCVAVLSVGRDKDARGLLKALAARVDRVHCTSVGERQWSPQELQALAAAEGLDAAADDSPGGAVASATAGLAPGGWVLVTGSLHLVGAVRGGLSASPPPEEPGCSPSAQTSS